MQRKIDIFINKILNPLIKDYRYSLLEKIINNSEEIFGAELGKNITPYEILTFVDKKEPKYLLKIIVTDSSVALKIDFQKERILNNIKIYTGEKNLRKLKISHSNEFDIKAIDIVNLKSSLKNKPNVDDFILKENNFNID